MNSYTESYWSFERLLMFISLYRYRQQGKIMLRWLESHLYGGNNGSYYCHCDILSKQDNSNELCYWNENQTYYPVNFCQTLVNHKKRTLTALLDDTQSVVSTHTQSHMKQYKRLKKQ